MSASWEILWRLIGPAFRTEMIHLHKQRKLRRRVCAVVSGSCFITHTLIDILQINGGMVGSRGEDANTFKKHVIQYLHEDITVAVEPVLNPATKIDRGWVHPSTARLLLPLKYPATQEYVNIFSSTMHSQTTGRTMPSKTGRSGSPLMISLGSCTSRTPCTTRWTSRKVSLKVI
jgi:hypothetical protein